MLCTLGLMFKFKKIYIELSDICGLNCSFCPSQKNIRKIMDIALFQKVCEQSVGLTQSIAFHLLGDPCILKNLKDYLKIAKDYGLKVDLVTSGVYLRHDMFDWLVCDPIAQLSLSLNAGFDRNNQDRVSKNYLENILSLCRYKIFKDSAGFINLRLQDSTLEELLWLKQKILREFGILDDNTKSRFRLGKKVFLNITKTFQWANPNSKVFSQSHKYCHGLIAQVGILADGSVVPCCIDAQGVIKLGNLKDQKLIDILQSGRAQNIREGFMHNQAVEKLCIHCSYPAKKS
ncbi:hypothetical protein BKH45_07285 [Helicobacter sp. 11S03491-1]|nr:hypothetical protein BKH45_07285 [Helicobacter sp. 11S03491-1]